MVFWQTSNHSKAIIIIQNVISVLFSGAIARAFALLNSVLVARMVSISEYGLFSTFYSIMILTWQFSQGIDTAYIKFYKNNLNKNIEENLLGVVILTKILYLVIMIVVATFLSEAIATNFFHKPEIKDIIFNAIISGAFISFLMSVMSYFQARERFKTYSLFYLLFTVSIFLCLMLMFLTTKFNTLRSVIYVYNGTSFIIALMSVLYLLKKSKFCIIKSKLLIEMLSFGKWAFLNGLIYYLFCRLDVLMVTKYLSLHDLGLYAAGTQIATIYTTFTGCMSGVFMPKAMLATKSKIYLKDYIFGLVTPTLFFMIIFICIIIASDNIIIILYGNKFEEAKIILKVITGGWMFYYFYAITQDLYYSLNKPMIRFAIEICKLGLGVILIIIFVPKYGAVGGAFAISLSMFVSTITSLVLLTYLIKEQLIINN